MYTALFLGLAVNLKLCLPSSSCLVFTKSESLAIFSLHPVFFSTLVHVFEAL